MMEDVIVSRSLSRCVANLPGKAFVVYDISMQVLPTAPSPTTTAAIRRSQNKELGDLLT